MTHPRILTVAPGLAMLAAASARFAQYASVLGYAQMHEDSLQAVREGIAKGKNRDELADTIRMQQYSHFRNYHHMRGWVYALHHLLPTGKPMAVYP